MNVCMCVNVNINLYFVILALYEKAEVKQQEEDPKHLVIAVSSDRGLCGGIHSGLAKAIKASLAENPNRNTMIISFGDKTRQILQRTHGKY